MCVCEGRFAHILKNTNTVSHLPSAVLQNLHGLVEILSHFSERRVHHHLGWKIGG